MFSLTYVFLVPSICMLTGSSRILRCSLDTFILLLSAYLHFLRKYCAEALAHLGLYYLHTTRILRESLTATLFPF
jgi:hypothetical protein